MGKDIGGHFTKNYFDGRCVKCQGTHTNLHVATPTPHSGVMGHRLLKIFVRN